MGAERMRAFGPERGCRIGAPPCKRSFDSLRSLRMTVWVGGRTNRGAMSEAIRGAVSSTVPPLAPPMTLCLFEDATVAHLAPLALTRAASDLRTGARTLGERLAAAFPHDRLAIHARAAVRDVTAREHPDAARAEAIAGPTLFVNSRWLVHADATADLVARLVRTGEPRAVVDAHGALLALVHPDPDPAWAEADAFAPDLDGIATETAPAEMISRLWHLLDDVADRIAEDLDAIGGLGEIHGTVMDGAHLVAPERIHIGSGATVRTGAVLDATNGPIRLAPGATVGENAVLRGPVWLGPGATANPAARLDATAAGERCKLGGEVHASVLHSFSSKGHDGYLGNSSLGRWCNLGAATDTSNLKNDYGEVTQYDAVARDFVGTGRQFVGLVMGDHSKCSIHSMFNTGTVVGVFCNLYGAGFPPRYVPSFAWGGADGLVPYRTAKAFRVAEAVMARRDRELSRAERTLLTHISEDEGQGTTDAG